jgi:alpha-2-macroglobulin
VVQTAFYQNDSLINQKTSEIGPVFAEYTAINVPNDLDSVRVRYELRSANIADAEERSIAISPVGVEEVVGSSFFAPRDTTLLFTPEAGKGKVYFYALPDALSLLIQDVAYLIKYPYGCNEQTASRLAALLLAKEISQLRPNMIPHSDMDREINLCISRLRQTQHSSGYWGWWQGDNAEVWITAYVVRILNKARKAGYETVALKKGLNWLTANKDRVPLAQQHEVLSTLVECNVFVSGNNYLEELVKQVPFPEGISAYEQLAIMRVKQQIGQPVVRDSLLLYMISTDWGGLYSRSFLRDSNQYWAVRGINHQSLNNILAYDIALAAGWNDIAERIRLNWLGSRPVWRPITINCAEQLLRLIPYLLKDNTPPKKPQLLVNGMEYREFPLTIEFSGAEPVAINAAVGSGLYFKVYQSWFNPAPSQLNTGFKLSTTLKQRGEQVKNGQIVRSEPLMLTTSVAVPSTTEYVMVEIPIPAACSYAEKPQPGGYYWSGTLETHREYFRDRVVLFFRNLPEGKYEIPIQLQPRFSGQFTLNPARAEQMYFPVRNGHTGVERVVVRGE